MPSYGSSAALLIKKKLPTLFGFLCRQVKEAGMSFGGRKIHSTRKGVGGRMFLMVLGW